MLQLLVFGETLQRVVKLPRPAMIPQWQKQAAVGVLAGARCPDCPLDGGARTAPCPIHKKWLELLRRYAAAELSAREYVEDTLKLLGTRKDRLRVGQARRRLPDGRCVPAPG